MSAASSPRRLQVLPPSRKAHAVFTCVEGRDDVLFLALDPVGDLLGARFGGQVLILGR